MIIPPLFLDIIYNNIEGAKILIAAGAYVNARDDDGLTLLMYASLFGRPEIAKMLIEAGADVNDRINHVGFMNETWTALRIADRGAGRREGDEIIKLLEVAGARR